MTTSTQTQLRRGTSTQVNAMTPALGEVVVNTTDKTLHVGDGSTAGGTRLATKTYADGLLNNTALTGTPTAPTAAGGTNSTQLATTAFVVSEIAASSSMPAAVTGTTTTGSSTTLTVDFSTYSSYKFMATGLQSSGTTVTIDVSKDAFTTTATFAGNLKKISSTTVTTSSGKSIPLSTGRTVQIEGLITQPSATGDGTIFYTAWDETGMVQYGSGVYTLTAAMNRVKFVIDSGSFAAGNLILQPLSKR